MILKALFQVVLPQLLVRWLPIGSVLFLSTSGALAAGRAFGVGSTAALVAGFSVFGLLWLLGESFAGVITGRLMKTHSSEEFFLRLRERHGVALSGVANERLICLGHVLVGVAMAVLLFRLFGACDC
jgi:hypothetical protein